MATEYKLNYTASEIDEKLGKVDNAVLYTEQSLTDLQKAQARENIGAIERSECLSNISNYNAQNKVMSTRLSGLDKSGNSPIIQTADAESTVFVQYNEGVLEHVRLSNKNQYPNKIGIDVAYPAQRLGFHDIFIDSDYALGVRLPTGYYSQFNTCWIRGETGISIGNEDGSGWIGVLDFNACHFGDSKLAFKVNTRDTNTICLDKCCFEGDDISIDNHGTLYVRNTYFGDQLDTGNPHGVLIARAGSKTYFSDSTIGLSAFAYGGRTSLFNLKSDTDSGSSIVTVNGGILNLSNSMNVTDSQITIYESDSPDNLIYIDFATFTPSSINGNHNYTPYYIYDGFTPLRSKFPLKNYVCNGTMKSELGNSLLLEASTGAVFDDAMMNPFGGSVLKAATNAKFFYKIPKHCVGQEMTLEVYLYTPTTDGFYLSSEGLGGVYFNGVMHTYESERTPVMYRINVIPTAEVGCITMAHSSNFNVYGVILKESHYKDILSCYEDSEELYSDKMPTTTIGAILGDVVHNTDINSDDWLHDGADWRNRTESLTYSLDFSGGKLVLKGSDGSTSSVSIAATKGVLYMLSNCISSNNDTTALEGEAYGTTILPNEDHVMSSVTVMMGDVDVTSSVYDSSTGQINIASVTGTIVITAAATYVPWTYTVPDLFGSHRCSWAWTLTDGTFGLALANLYLALTVSTENDFPKTDRHGNTVYPIPVPAKASKLTVTHTDGIIYKYDYAAIKKLADGSASIVAYEYSNENCTYQWTAGEIDYILINCMPADGSEVPWEYDNSTVSVMFSKWEDDEM